ncbi:MAG: VOC family protein [Acidobacteria bacterium]|nr:VOC family protein [Acidobacteriota bacterium]
MLERLDHIALFTSDARRAAAFYCEWAGMKILHERLEEETRVVWVRLAHDDNSLMIVLLETDEQRPSGWMDHFGFHVGNRAEVDEIAARARRAGILAEEPQYAGPVVGYFCMIRDPDGNLLEFSCEQLKA